jgi:hypothetical protein
MRTLGPLLLIATLAGCATPPIVLRLDPGESLYDQNSFSPDLKGKPLRVMIVPPPADTSSQSGLHEGPAAAAHPPPLPGLPLLGRVEETRAEAAAPEWSGRSGDGRYGPDIALLERALMARGFTVVAFEETIKELAARNGAQLGNLSDVERALLGARAAGADVILQIADFTWSTSAIPDRFFVLRENALLRAEEAEFLNFQGPRWELASQHLRFEARLLDADTGKVLASVKSVRAADADLSSTYQALFELDHDRLVPTAESPRAYPRLDWASAKRRAELRVVSEVVAKLVDKMAAAAPAAAKPASEETKPPETPDPGLDESALPKPGEKKPRGPALPGD